MNSDTVTQHLAGMTALASSLLAQLVQGGRNPASANPLSNVNNSSATLMAMKSSVPDGSGLIRYRAPDMDSLVFDQNTGYRYDPTTGLHYDANSGFFINHGLGILLRWDQLFNTYLKAGDLTSLRPTTNMILSCAEPQTAVPTGMELLALNSRVTSTNIPPVPVTVNDAVTRITANALLGSQPPPSYQNAASIQSSKWERSLHEKVLDSYEKKQLRENADGKHVSSDGNASNLTWLQRTTETNYRRGRRNSRHRGASRSRSRSPAGKIMDSGKRVASRRSRSSSSSRRHKSRKLRSVSRGRKRSRSHSREARRSYIEGPQSLNLRRDMEGHRGSYTHSDYKQPDGSHYSRTKRKEGIRSRLGSSYKKQNLGPTYPADSNSKSQTSIHAWNRKRNLPSRGQDRKGSQLSSLANQEVVTVGCQNTLDNKPVREDEAPGHRKAKPTGIDIVDIGDVMGYLFSYRSFTNVILVAPVPLKDNSKNASNALRNQIGYPTDLLNIYLNYDDSSGSPCRFMVLSFKTSDAAKQWYDSKGGTIVLSGEDGSKLKAYLHYLKKGNWSCTHCKGFNFFIQSLCSKCYRAKDNGFSPVTIVEEPTKWVGIAKLESNYPTVESVMESLPSLRTFNIKSIQMISEPCGLPLKLCVLEVENSVKATWLHNFIREQNRNAVYVAINEKPKTPDEKYLALLFDRMTPTNVLLVALMPLTQIPDMKFELSLMELYLLMLLKEDGVKCNQITLHIDNDVGAPYSYGLITFPDTDTATRWLKSRRTTFKNFMGRSSSSQQGSSQRSTISVHFSDENWECHSCHTLNFSLRSLCHRCFKHRDQKKLLPISHSPTTTRWVAISDFSNWSKSDEYIVAHFRELLKEFIHMKIELVRDPKCHSLPLACVFEMQGKREGLRLREHFTMEGRFSSFVVMHKDLDERTSIDISNSPDVIIVGDVDEPPTESIDLTSEDNIIQPAPASIDLTGEDNHLKKAEVTRGPEIDKTVIEQQRPAVFLDLTSDDIPTQETEKAGINCVSERIAPVVELQELVKSPDSTSEDNVTQLDKAEISCVLETSVQTQVAASIDLTTDDDLSQNMGKENTSLPELMTPEVSLDLMSEDNLTQPKNAGVTFAPQLIKPVVEKNHQEAFYRSNDGR